jgi:CHAD domain-containing protein
VAGAAEGRAELRRSNAAGAAVLGAAAAAAAAAVAVGVRLAARKLSPRSSGQPSRAYRLQAGEAVPDGFRRISRGQLDAAREELDGVSSRRFAEAIHDTRKRLKRLRAALRLVRPAIGDATYQRENAAFRDTGRRLSRARDAKVLIDTLDGLVERHADELALVSTSALRAQLEGEHRRAVASLRSSDAAIALSVRELGHARMRTAGWTFEREGLGAVAPGLRRIYRRGRRGMRQAAAEPSTENLHEWRKRVKDLWHASQILRHAAPKRMRKLSKRAHRLSELLGDDHDLAVLRDRVAAHPGQFEDPESRQALLGVIDRRRALLQRDAFGLGKSVYKRPAKSFMRRFRADWRKRMGN